MGISIYWGPIGDLGGGSFHRDLERQMESSGNSISLCGSSVRGICREGSFTGNPE